MKETVGNLAIPDAMYCRPDHYLAQIVEILWNAGCGALPAPDTPGHVMEILTDRDISIETGASHEGTALTLVPALSRARRSAHPAGNQIYCLFRPKHPQSVHRSQSRGRTA